MAAAKIKNVQPRRLIGMEQDPEQHHAADVQQGRASSRKISEIKNEEYRGAETIEEPHRLTLAWLSDRIDEEEAEIKRPRAEDSIRDPCP